MPKLARPMSRPGTTKNPISLLLDLCSSVKVGIVLMILLFIYCGVGSAGLPLHWALWEPTTWYQLREASFLEMTEFEWFHWWPFHVLLAMLSLVLITTTLRRIPLNTTNLGVWTIHTGIIVLILGSVIYFSLKIEGDVPIARGRLTITLPGQDPVSMLAMPGHTTIVGEGNASWSFMVTSIDPNWELLSGDDKGKRAYAVTVGVVGPSPGQRFMRQVILGYPEYTEDLVGSGDPSQPFSRAIKVHGTRTIEPNLSITIAPDIRTRFYLMGTTAIWLREVDVLDDGSIRPRTPWIERPVKGLPRFNDSISAAADIWPAGVDHPATGSLGTPVPPVSAADPMGDVTLRVSDYLRAAQLSTRTEPGGEQVYPLLRVQFSTENGRTQKYDMYAFDESLSNADPSLMRFVRVEEESAVEDMLLVTPPRIQIQVAESGLDETVKIEPIPADGPAEKMIPITGTPYSYRVLRQDDNLSIEGRVLSMARVEIERDGDRWLRWVFDDPSLNGDIELPPEGSVTSDHVQQRRTLDERIQMQYLPPAGPVAPVLFVSGPGEEQLRLLTSLSPGEPPVLQEVTVGEDLELVPGILVTPTVHSVRSTTSTKPAIVPRRQRDPSLSNQLSMIRVQVPGQGDGGPEAWLAYHHWPFESATDTLRRFIYQPTLVEIPGGRTVQMLLSRASYPLPTPVQLEGFEVASHVGGFTGNTSSVLNWISRIGFGTGTAMKTRDVSVNNPQEEDGFWFFQSQWDPPDRARFQGDIASAGLNYTVLGVGNRHGVWIQLSGGTLMVLGMLYAFYIKPVLIRRRQDRPRVMEGGEG